MSINHYSPDLPEAHWWSQYTLHESPAKISSSSSSSSFNHKSSFINTNLIPHKTAEFWADTHPNNSAAAMFGRRKTAHSFNLNNEDEEEFLDEQVNSDDRYNNRSNDINSSNTKARDQLIEQEESLKQPLFEKPLTPSDVGKLNRLVIPKQHAEKYFPLNGAGDSNEKGLLLSFEDEMGKSWRFRYSYWNSSQSYVLTKGWSRFVKEKRLDAGDIVLFFRHPSDTSRLFIGWRRRNSGGQETSTAIPQPGSGNGWNRAFNYSSSGYHFPNQPHRSSSLPYQPDCLHAGSSLQNQTPTVSGNSKRLRLFGVNLECQADESEPSTPEDSPVSSQGQTHQHPYHQFYSNHQNHMDMIINFSGGGDVYRQG